MNKYTCSECGKPFYRYKAQVRNAGTVCCSLLCVARRLKTTGTGKNNPNYKHGKCIDDKKCSCGNRKDRRSVQCARCARCGYSRKGAVPLRNFTPEKFSELVKQSRSFLDLAEKTKLSRATVTRLTRTLALSIDHFVNCSYRVPSAEKILVKRAKGKRRNHVVKSCILREKLLPYTCSECGQGSTWNNKKLVLELHHKDGDGLNDELGNLEFLCPNCHTQTKTYKGSNAKRTSKASKE